MILKANRKILDRLKIFRKKKLKAQRHSFLGEIMQVPPAHSAIKVEGKRVYELARKGKEVKLEPRKSFYKRI